MLSATPKIMQNIYDTDYYDNLTRLPNLRQFRILSKQIIQSQAMRTQDMVFVYFSLKNFMDFRKYHRKEDGDTLIELVAQIIQTTFQDRIAARISKEHFAVITTNDGLPSRLEEIYDDIHALRHDVAIELKAGIYVVDPADEDADAALDKARTACKSITDKTDVHYIYYNSKLDAQSMLSRYVREQLRDAIAEGHIVPYYQPLVDAYTGKTCCYEVYARWRAPVYGELGPEEFADVLEEYHLIHELDLWLIRQVCENFHRMREQGLPLFPVVVSISGKDFIFVDMADEIETIMTNMKVPRNYLHLEIEEHAFSEDSGYVLEKATEKLRKLGYEIWVDDFGRGYSSLRNLENYVFDVLKIDRSFMSDLKKESRSLKVLSAIVQMAKTMGLKTVIQGVETEKDAGILKNIGCDMEQGSCFGRPVPLDTLILN